MTPQIPDLRKKLLTTISMYKMISGAIISSGGTEILFELEVKRLRDIEDISRALREALNLTPPQGY